MLACADTKEAIVVDPGGEHQRILEIVRHYDLTVKWIIHTHAHLDHIYETRDVKEGAGGTIALHKDDLFLYDGFAMQAAMFGWQVRPVLPVEHWLTDGESLAFGKRAAEVIHTPGHTPGSCCFRVAPPTTGRCSSPATRCSRARSDAPICRAATSDDQRSIQQKIYTLDPDTSVIPGHGPRTTVGDEARHNPFVQGA